MARTVQLSEEAYATLAALKREGESFSDTVRRLASSVKDPRALLDLGPRAEGFEAFRQRMRDVDDERIRGRFAASPPRGARSKKRRPGR